MNKEETNMAIKDAATIMKIAMSVLSLFSFSNMQEKQINTYVKDNMYKWIAARKSEEEIESLIKSAANRISGS